MIGWIVSSGDKRRYRIVSDGRFLSRPSPVVECLSRVSGKSVCCHALEHVKHVTSGLLHRFFLRAASTCLCPIFLRCSLWRQTGMRHAYGKPQGTTARVAIGQVSCSLNSIVMSWLISFGGGPIAVRIIVLKTTVRVGY